MKRHPKQQPIEPTRALERGQAGLSARGTKRAPLLAGLLFAAAMVPTAHANLIQNGSFELPASGGTQVGVTPTGWQLLGNGSAVDIIHAGYYGAFASDGDQFVDLISNGTTPSGLKQSVDLLGGVTYHLLFDYNGATYLDGSHTVGRMLEYALGSLVSGSMNVDDLNAFAWNNHPTTPWQTESVIFTAPSDGTYELVFSTPDGHDGSPYVDNVRLEEVTSVPEPLGTALLGLGIAGLGLSGFSKRQRCSRG